MRHKEHDRKLAIKEWFSALEPGIAELQIEPSPYNDGFTDIDIQPTRTPEAAPILLHVGQEHGWIFSYVSELRDEDPEDWPNLTVLDACQAIIDGRITDTIRLWRGKEVARTTCLHMPNEKVPNCHMGADGCIAPLTLLIGTLLRRINKQLIQYPSY